MFATIAMLNFADYSFATFGTGLSVCMAALISMIAIHFAFNVFLGYFIHWDYVVRKEDETEEEEEKREAFLAKSGYFLENLNTEKHGRWSLLFPVLDILRRLFIAASAVWLQNFPNFMVFSLIFTSLSLLILFLHQRPFRDPAMNRNYFWYEGLTLVVVYHLIGMTKLNPLAYKRKNVSISMITIISFALVKSIWQGAMVEGLWPILKKVRAWLI